MRLDTKLSALQRIVSPLKLKHSGYAFLVSSNGTIITHPADSLALTKLSSVSQKGQRIKLCANRKKND